MSSSVFRLFEEAVQSHGDLTAVLYPVKGEFRELRWQQVYEKVISISSSLLALNTNVQDRVAIIAKTRLEWTLIDLATLGVAACTVPLYHSNSDEDILYILKDCEAAILFIENMALLTRLRKLRPQLPALKHVILIEGHATLSAAEGEMTFVQFLALGQDRDDTRVIRERLDVTTSNDLASIVYTSGTTGVPKGAMITHDNFLYEAHAIEKLGLISASEVQLLFLPLAHIFARVLQIAWLKTKHVVAFAEDFEHLSENILATRPTLLGAVPRVFEKIHASVVQQGLSSPGFKKRLVKWAFDEADAKRESEIAGEQKSSFTWMLADYLVFSKIKARLQERFGGRLRLLISGGAPLSPEINYFFRFAGLTILEGWGLTETTAATCLNVPASNRIGTVGQPLPGTELKIASDGEILVRGRGVFKGYWKKEEATRDSFDEEGFFRTGDIGVLQPGGFLKITDRKKDVIVTAAGKNVAPQKLEGLYKSASPLIAQAVIYGDKKPYVVGLFTLDEAALLAFAKENGLKGGYAALTKNPSVRAHLEKKLAEVNVHLAGYEQVKKFVILDHDFTIGEQLTPTLKVKRKYCSERYADVFESLYENS